MPLNCVCLHIFTYVQLLNDNGYIMQCIWGMCLESSSFIICLSLLCRSRPKAHSRSRSRSRSRERGGGKERGKGRDRSRDRSRSRERDSSRKSSGKEKERESSRKKDGEWRKVSLWTLSMYMIVQSLYSLIRMGLTFTHVCVDSSRTILEHHRPFYSYLHVC